MPIDRIKAQPLTELSAKDLHSLVYLPLQQWLAQHGISYPWNRNRNRKGNGNPLHGKLDALSPWALDGSQIRLPSPLPDAYHTWVSEVMLQQTRTSTAGPYFENWLRLWPTLRELAFADESRLLKAWEGLGYYNRLSNMQLAAQQIISQGDEHLPSSAAKLLALPGIGSYTAAAVASISFNETVLALDTNVKRVLARLHQEQEGQKAVELHWQEQHAKAIALCPWRGSANISLIQLGQQVCLARKPLCHICPLSGICLAKHRQNWHLFPKPRIRKTEKLETQRIICIAAGKILLLQNRHKHLKRLWRFPTMEWLQAQQCIGQDKLAPSISQPISQGISQGIFQAEYLGSFRHAYLQVIETVRVSVLEYPELYLQLESSEDKNWRWQWASFSEIEELTLAGPYRRFWDEAKSLLMNPEK